MAAMSADTLTLGVVIPCLNEAERLPLLLADLQRWQLSIEITVVDGGSKVDLCLDHVGTSLAQLVQGGPKMISS